MQRKVLSGAVAAEAAEAKGPGWDLQREGASGSDGDEEDAMASSAESSAGEDDRAAGGAGWPAWVAAAGSLPPFGSPGPARPLGPPWLWRPLRSPGRREPP